MGSDPLGAVGRQVRQGEEEAGTSDGVVVTGRTVEGRSVGVVGVVADSGGASGHCGQVLR